MPLAETQSPQARQLNVVAIGAGYFSGFHFSAWQRLPGCTLAAIVELDAGRRRQLETQFPDILIAATLADVTSRVSVDIVDIITPPHTHRQQIDSAIALTGHALLICQKPFCADRETAAAVASDVANLGRTLVVHENFRFQPWYREIKQLIVNGTVGQVMQASFRLRPGDGQGPDAYLSRQPYFRDMPRFLIHETGIHWVDVFRFLFGEPDAVSAELRTLNPAIKGEDAGHFIFHYSSGLRAMFDGNRHLDHAAGNPRLTMGEMLIEGTGGDLTLNGDGVIHTRAFGQKQPTIHHYEYHDIDFGGDCVYHLNRHIAEHLMTGSLLHNEADQYLKNLRLEDLIYTAAKEKNLQQADGLVDHF